MKATDYAIIQGWMYSIRLTDKQRLAYAIIWNYSRDGRSVCRTTAAHLAEWLVCSERHVKRIINELEDLGLIQHQVVAVPKRRNHPGGVMTDFWAILPDEAQTPEMKDRIDWLGRRKVGTWVSRPGRDLDVPTPHKGIKSTNIYPRGGGKYTTRSRAKGTTTTGFLFENNGSGLAAGESLSLPYTEIYFVEAWERLLRQPAWAAKTTGALELELQTLADVADAIIAAYCCDLAVKKGWDTIKDPAKVYADDIEQVEAYGEICHAKERRAGQ